MSGRSSSAEVREAREAREARDTRHAESIRSLTNSTNLGAFAVSAATAVASWGDWHAVRVICAAQLVLIPFNMMLMTWVMRAAGPATTEVLRTIVNMAGFVVLAQLTGFPFAMWLWLPFVALTFDDFNRRLGAAILILTCAIPDAVALYDGVSWRYPFVFTTLAFVCRATSRARFGVIREMVLRADAHRRALERAHADIQNANVALTDETNARMQLELERRQEQKLEAVGRLAAGIAHEINTPVQFVADGVRFMGEATGDLLALVEEYRQALGAAGAVATADAAAERADLAYLSENVPASVDRTLDGLERIATIVRSMKEFAHPDDSQARAVDLNRAIETTLVIARHEYKLIADVETHLGDVPLVTCMAGEVNQVLLNIIVNAAHAIGDVVKEGQPRGRISITTRRDGDHVLVAIADTGTGIPESVRARVFDPFFTTKPIGKGTGQGLAMAHAVVARHRGSIYFESEVGKGTTFFVRLPISRRQGAEAAASASHRPSALGAKPRARAEVTAT